MYGNVNNVDFMDGVSPTKKSIKDYLCLYSGCTDVVLIDDFETVRARHICKGSCFIQLLDKQVVPVPTSQGIVNVEVFFCSRCGKLIINNSSLELI